MSASLPEFPWDTLADAKAQASAHPDGIVDLSVGTPVDPVAPVISDALAGAGAASGYPATAGTARLREAAVAALARRFGVTGLAEADVLPVIGSKELIAWLPTLLGLGSADMIVVPELAYPTYDVGARLAGARVLRADSLTQLGPQSPALYYLNSPSNPTGRVLGVDHLRKVVGWARDRGCLVASDECYLGLGWDAQPLSILHPSVCDGDHTGLLAIHSLSKSSSLAGYRAGFVAGDSELVAELLAVRKHAGMMVPRRCRPPWWPPCRTTRTSCNSGSATSGAGPPCCRPCVRPASRSTIPKPASISGSPAASPVTTASPGWRSAASWWPPGSSTARAAHSMCALR